VKSVSERADAHTWTCRVQTSDGRLPDMKALARCIREVGEPFSVRGVEATVDGLLIEEEGRLTLWATGTGEKLRLAPLRRKVQWDPRAKRDYPPTQRERNAFKNLVAQWKGSSRLIRIIGPLAEAGEGEPLTLEVREFRWRQR